MSDHERRSSGFGRRVGDRSDEAHEQARSEMRTAQDATERAHVAQREAERERSRMVDERSAYQAARRADQAERWDDDGGSNTRFRRNSPAHRQDLYDSDFSDFEQMTRDRRDD